MNTDLIEKLAIIAFSSILFISMLWSSIWYIHPVLGGISIYFWYAGKKDRIQSGGFFLFGQISAISMWYVSPLFAFLIQCVTVALFLLSIDRYAFQSQHTSFFIFCGFVAVMTIVCSTVNHTVVPAILFGSAFSLAILYGIVVEFRLQKQYSGEYS